MVVVVWQWFADALSLPHCLTATATEREKLFKKEVRVELRGDVECSGSE